MCPYYGKNENYCDVGCGYISSYDVSVIIRYCMRRHADCMKYRELVDRLVLPDVSDNMLAIADVG
jgi:hypothetical protein